MGERRVSAVTEQGKQEDLIWISQIRNGDTKAFSHLVKKYQKSLLRVTLRFVKELSAAEDVVQEAFMKAYERLDSFEGRAGFRSWLFQIAVNTAKNKLRERRDGHSDLDSVQLSVAAEAEDGLQQQALSKLISKAVETLPFRQKTALVLRIYEDLSFKEIAEIMACPYDTAKANYRHALLKLKDEFDLDSELKTWNFDGPASGVGQIEFLKKRTEVET